MLEVTKNKVDIEPLFICEKVKLNLFSFVFQTDIFLKFELVILMKVYGVEFSNDMRVIFNESVIVFAMDFSYPDISMLPEIAMHFGVTVDDLK